MNKIKLYLLALCVIAANITASYGQKSDASIFGHVVDKKTGEHLSYVTIALEGTTVAAVSDATGHYMLNNLPVGKFTMRVSAVGYATVDREVTTSRNNSLECKFELEEQTIQVNQLVVSSTRNETDKRFSPTIVNVVSDKVFENTSSCNLAESMNFQPGLRTENTCGNCGSAQLRINGLEGQYSQILLDSRPLFSSLAGVYGLEQLPVAMMERVEVIRGGGSALFGSSAIGGVVNIITKEPLRSSATISNTTNIFGDANIDQSTSLNASVVSADGRAGAYIFGSIRNRDAYDRNEDGFSDLPELDSEMVGFRGYFKASTYSKIIAEYHHLEEYRRGGDNLDELPHNAAIAEQIETSMDGGGLTFEHLSPNYDYKYSVYTSAQHLVRDTYYGADYDPDAYGNTIDDTFVGGGQFTSMYDWFFMPADFTVGMEYTYNNLHDVMEGYDRDLMQTTHLYGAFIQNEWKSEKLNFVIGGRLDKHNLVDNVIFSPRASARFSPNSNIGLRASYSSGYRAPQAFNEDLHIEAVAGSVKIIEIDPDLRPEYSHSISASVDLYRDFNNVSVNLMIDGFYTMIDDVFTLEQLSDDENSADYYTWVRSNASGATVKGVSADLMVGIGSRFDIQGGYTFQKSLYDEAEEWSENVEATRTMFRSPDHYGYFTANYDVTKRFAASIFGTYTGSMLVQHCEGWAPEDCNVETDAFFDMGVKLTYNIPVTSVFNIELNGGVKNIFDSYQSDLEVGAGKDAGYTYGPAMPRTYFVGAKLMF